MVEKEVLASPRGARPEHTRRGNSLSGCVRIRVPGGGFARGGSLPPEPGTPGWHPSCPERSWTIARNESHAPVTNTLSRPARPLRSAGAQSAFALRDRSAVLTMCDLRVGNAWMGRAESSAAEGRTATVPACFRFRGVERVAENRARQACQGSRSMMIAGLVPKLPQT